MSYEDREQRSQTICLLILTVIATAAALYWLRPVLMPFVVAVFFSMALTPVVDFQTRMLKVPAGIAVLFTLIVFFAGLSMLASLVSSSLAQLSSNASAYQAQILTLFEQARTSIPFERLGLDDSALPMDLQTLAKIPAKVIGGLFMRTTNAILDLISQGFIVLIFVFFLLSGGTSTPREPGTIQREIESRIKRYLVSQGLLSLVTGILVGTILMTLGVDLALVFGLFAFLLNFIPSIGSVIATLLPLPVVLVSPEIGTSQAILAIAVPGAVQFMIGNVISPRVMGDALDLHPVTILLGLMFWGALWGIVGMLLATPITAILKILMERFDVTAPLAELLAGQHREVVG